MHMKTKYLLVAVLCCVVFGACQNDAPGKGSKEISEQLGDFIEGLGNIVSTDSLNNGSIVMKDDKDNTITKDKDGNIVIVNPQGDTTYIDNSIKEDESALKDKWYNSTWSTNKGDKNNPAISMPEIPDFINYLQELGFSVEQNNISIDTTITEQEKISEYIIHFLTTTGSLLQLDTLKQHTYTRSINYLKITFFPEEIGNDELKYELVINESYLELHEKHYYYDEEAQQYFLEWEDVRMCTYIDEGTSILLYRGEEIMNLQTVVLSTKTTTTWCNYRRLSETQIAVNNNSLSAFLNEVQDSSTPEMEARDLQGKYLASFWLVSF